MNQLKQIQVFFIPLFKWVNIMGLYSYHALYIIMNK